LPSASKKRGEFFTNNLIFHSRNALLFLQKKRRNFWVRIKRPLPLQSEKSGTKVKEKKRGLVERWSRDWGRPKDL
jgi:hypothetical protein